MRFLWRFALRRFRRLCFDIFRRRFFLRLPMVRVIEAGNVRPPLGGVQPEFYPHIPASNWRRKRVNTTAARTATSGNPVNRATACR